MKSEDRIARTEIVLDALIQALVSSGAITHTQIQQKILELGSEEDDNETVN